MTVETLSPRHQANITRKARRAMDTILTFAGEEHLATGATVTEVLTVFRRALTSPASAEEAWRLLAEKHDVARGTSGTSFNTSRPMILEMLDLEIERPLHPTPGDPFTGLTGAPDTNRDLWADQILEAF